MVADRAVVIAALHRRWESVLPGRTRLGADLIARWSEPHRYYHDLGHLSDALAALDLLGPASRSEEIALWFHDAVHTSSPGHDEQLSAALAAQELPAVGMEAAEVAEIVRLVLVTIDHVPAAGDAAGARVSDADLAILGAEPERYQASVLAVRAEAASMDEAVVPHGTGQLTLGRPGPGQPRSRRRELPNGVTPSLTTGWALTAHPLGLPSNRPCRHA